MILTCPSCATRYFVDDAAIGATGRKVRCIACGHVWRAEPEAEDFAIVSAQAPPVLDAPDPLAIADAPFRSYDAAATTKAKRTVRAWAGLAAAPGLAVVLAVVSAWMFRSEVVAFWPQASSVYAMIGIRATATGLVFENVEATPQPGGMIEVRARVRNVSGRARATPLVRVRMRDSTGAVAAQTFATLPVTQLAPGETVEFVTTAAGAPGDVDALELTFEPLGGAGAAAAAPDRATSDEP